ncbi:hypothetical protein K0M31_005424 [Melipona bicolor]|uniref:Uncharacterized protein n=1 Tax=Melipona bicolor TaxID=60889 RepID=A0AA40FW04_9HYME|nr:hypothetical protein K0M31_005424 [Melipona bicolor]
MEPERKTDVDAARRYRKQVHRDGQMSQSPLLHGKMSEKSTNFGLTKQAMNKKCLLNV